MSVSHSDVLSSRGVAQTRAAPGTLGRHEQAMQHLQVGVRLRKAAATILDTLPPSLCDTRPMSARIFITAAEVSGDRHAAQLIAALRQLQPELLVEGLGGPQMLAAGAVIHRDTVSKAAMGWRGALRAFEVMAHLRWAKKHFQQHRPDLLIGVDSPSMNIHFAKLARRLGIPVLQFVAPQLWAWASWRMGKFRRYVDQVACILPFEEDYFRSRGVNATFVGHPLFDQLPADRAADDSPRFPQRPPVIGLLAGSRRSEAAANFPHMLNVAEQIARKFSDATFLAPTTAATHPVVQRLSSAAAIRIEVAQDQFDQMVPRCDLCLTVSGTATLHVASYGVPMIVVYRVSRFVWNVLARWVVPTRTFALVNVLAAHSAGPKEAAHVIPEFVPWYGSNQPVIDLALEYLNHPQRLADQRAQLSELLRPLDHPGASLKTAQLALEMIRTSAARV